ncbi:hypothetical protein D3C81_1516810 [compost metagenome]
MVQGGELCVEAAIETRHQAWQLVHRGGDLCVHQFFGVGVGVTGVAAYVVAEQDQVLADLVDRFAAYYTLLGIGQGAYLGANGLDAGERTGGKGAHFLLCRAHFLVRLEALCLVGGIPAKGLLGLVDQRQALWLDQRPAQLRQRRLERFKRVLQHLAFVFCAIGDGVAQARLTQVAQGIVEARHLTDHLAAAYQAAHAFPADQRLEQGQAQHQAETEEEFVGDPEVAYPGKHAAELLFLCVGGDRRSIPSVRYSHLYV